MLVPHPQRPIWVPADALPHDLRDAAASQRRLVYRKVRKDKWVIVESFESPLTISPDANFGIGLLRSVRTVGLSVQQ